MQDFGNCVGKGGCGIGNLLYTGFANRISPEYIGNDGSTYGRIALWTGGLKMVAQVPVCAWGVDKSGEEYTNWYQDFPTNANMREW